MSRTPPVGAKQYETALAVTRESVRRIQELIDTEVAFWGQQGMGTLTPQRLKTSMLMGGVREGVAEELAESIRHSSKQMLARFEALNEALSEATRELGSLEHMIGRIALRKRQAAESRLVL